MRKRIASDTGRTEAGLPAPTDYYRPARAKALRRWAARLAWWKERDWLEGLLIAGTIGLGEAAALADLSLPLVLLAVVGLMCGLLLVTAVPRTLSHWSPRLEAEASALEREHAARYGALPVLGEQKGCR